jgi:hypothetical protein
MAHKCEAVVVCFVPATDAQESNVNTAIETGSLDGGLEELYGSDLDHLVLHDLLFSLFQLL